MLDAWRDNASLPSTLQLYTDTDPASILSFLKPGPSLHRDTSRFGPLAEGRKCDWHTSVTWGRVLPCLSLPWQVPSFTATKLLWLKRHEPEAFQRARHLLLPASYINYWLTGNMAMEVRMDSIMVVRKCGFWDVWGAPRNTLPRGELHSIGVFRPIC